MKWNYEHDGICGSCRKHGMMAIAEVKMKYNRGGDRIRHFSRRKFISALGAIGVAFLTGKSLLSKETWSAEAASDQTELPAKPEAEGSARGSDNAYPCINVKDYGAQGDGVADDTEALQRAVRQWAERGGKLLVPAGTYLVTDSITPGSYVHSSVRRAGGLTIEGENMYASIIRYAGKGYCLDFSKIPAFDSIVLKDIQVAAESGGGALFGQGGQITFERYFSNGAASGKYGVYMDGQFQGGKGVYMVAFRDCRFWKNEEFGGYEGQPIFINDYHTVYMSGTFVSQQRYDGPIIELKNGKNASLRDVALEGMNDRASRQSLVKLTGFNSNVTLENVYLEGNWNSGIVTDAAGAQRNVQIRNLYAWCYGSNTAKVLRAESKADTVSIDGLIYKSDSRQKPLADNYIIEEAGGGVRIANFYNNSTSQEGMSRKLTSSSSTDERR